jgi:hypothetical protein
MTLEFNKQLKYFGTTKKEYQKRLNKAIALWESTDQRKAQKVLIRKYNKLISEKVKRPTGLTREAINILGAINNEKKLSKKKLGEYISWIFELRQPFSKVILLKYLKRRNPKIFAEAYVREHIPAEKDSSRKGCEIT